MIDTTSSPSEEKVLAYLQDLLHARFDECMRVYEKKATMGPSITRCNAFYAKVLFDIVFGQTPTLHQFSGMGFKESDEAIFQAAVFHYEKWKKLGTMSSIFSYCDAANRLLRRLMECNGIEKKDEFPDVRADVYAIDEQLKKIRAGK